MSVPGFIRGGAKEVPLGDILPRQKRSFSTRADQEAIAQAYEHRHGVMVVRPWENDEEQEKRRITFRGSPAVPQLAEGMSAERAERHLRLLWDEFDGSDSAERRAVLKDEITKIEKIIGKKPTDWTKPRKRAGATAIPDEYQQRLNQYRALDSKKREHVISKLTDPIMLALIRDTEDSDSLRAEAIARIVVVQAAE